MVERVAKKRVKQQKYAGHIILVTGMSGAGRSFTLKTLEDIGYETVDNLPLSLLRLMTAPSALADHAIAIGIDVRARDFSVSFFLDQIRHFQAYPHLELEVIFCDCDNGVLARRYTETRRPHPLADEKPILDGIRAERLLLGKIRENATFLLDTTNLSLTETRHILRNHFALPETKHLFIQVMSFAFRHGIPREADIVYDVRFLKNPHYEDSLKKKTGLTKNVGAFIKKDPAFESFLHHTQETLSLMIPRFDEEGRGYFTVAFGCTGGQHRSVFLAEKIFKWLKKTRKYTDVSHRDL